MSLGVSSGDLIGSWRPQYIIGTQIHGRKLRSLPPRCYVGFGVVWRPSALELKWMVADNR